MKTPHTKVCGVGDRQSQEACLKQRQYWHTKVSLGVTRTFLAFAELGLEGRVLENLTASQKHPEPLTFRIFCPESSG